MNIHLPAILGFTRYQGFDPSPHGLWLLPENNSRDVSKNDNIHQIPGFQPEMRQHLAVTGIRLNQPVEWRGWFSLTASLFLVAISKQWLSFDLNIYV